MEGNQATQHVLIGSAQRGISGENVGFGLDDRHFGLGFPHRQSQLATRQAAADDDDPLAQ